MRWINAKSNNPLNRHLPLSQLAKQLVAKRQEDNDQKYNKTEFLRDLEKARNFNFTIVAESYAGEQREPSPLSFEQLDEERQQNIVQSCLGQTLFNVLFDCLTMYEHQCNKSDTKSKVYSPYQQRNTCHALDKRPDITLSFRDKAGEDTTLDIKIKTDWIRQCCISQHEGCSEYEFRDIQQSYELSFVCHIQDGNHTYYDFLFYVDDAYPHQTEQSINIPESIDTQRLSDRSNLVNLVNALDNFQKITDHLAALEHGDDDNSAFISTAGETVNAIIDDLFKPSCSSHSSGESVADEKIHQLLSSYNEIYSSGHEKSSSNISSSPTKPLSPLMLACCDIWDITEKFYKPIQLAHITSHPEVMQRWLEQFKRPERDSSLQSQSRGSSFITVSLGSEVTNNTSPQQLIREMSIFNRPSVDSIKHKPEQNIKSCCIM